MFKDLRLTWRWQLHQLLCRLRHAACAHFFLLMKLLNCCSHCNRRPLQETWGTDRLIRQCQRAVWENLRLQHLHIKERKGDTNNVSIMHHMAKGIYRNIDYLFPPLANDNTSIWCLPSSLLVRLILKIAKKYLLCWWCIKDKKQMCVLRNKELRKRV